MITRREAAQRLDIPPEMATRHGLPARMSEAALAEIESHPPAWLAQSRANRRPTSRSVWQRFECVVCGHSETVRPKKWWPRFTVVACDDHRPDELPDAAPGTHREDVAGIGSRLVGILDRAD